MVQFLARILWLFVAVAFYAHPAFALPAGGQVTGGKADIASAPNAMTVNQASERAVIDWNSFNISGNETVQFIQPSVSSITLNRIHDAQASMLDGQLLANGNVWLLNPNGMVFGRNAQVNIGGLLATASGIGNENFMAGRYDFIPGGNPGATVSNAGVITVAQSGLAGFVAPNVSNSGIIRARFGKVALASGDSFTLDMYGDNLINLQVSDRVGAQLVANHGTIQADGGTVSLTAAAASTVVNGVINMDGIIQADSVGTKHGEVVLYAGGSNAVAGNVVTRKGTKAGVSTVSVSGTINATGYGNGQTGGTVGVLGDNVKLSGGARIDASGDAGGGTIRIGGDFHGQGVTPVALNTVIEPGASLKANAVSRGNGGNIAVWADNSAIFGGSIWANAGELWGNGGFVETSGKRSLDVFGRVSASARNGNAGTWLMDPNDVTISASGTSNMGGGPNFSDTGSPANVNTADIIAALDGGTSVNVTASGSVAVNSPITENSYNGVESLTIAAGRDITLANNVAITASGSTKLNVTLDANTAGTGGAIALNSGSSITSNGGDITLGGGANPLLNPAVGDASYPYGISLNGASLSAGSGNITMKGAGYSVSANNLDGIGIVGSQVSTTTGNITMNGTGGNSGGGFYNVGIALDGSGSSTAISSSGGAISLTGQAGVNGTLNIGVYLFGNATITGTGGTSVAVNGTGGNNGGDFGIGIWLDGGAQNGITTQNGAISLTGQGGNNFSWYNSGVYIGNNSHPHVTSTGTGDITIMGTGGAGTGDYNRGVVIDGGIVTVANGNMAVSGQGGVNGGVSDWGVNIQNSGNIGSTGSGNITVSGVAGGSATAGITTLLGSNTVGEGMVGNLTFVADNISLSNLAISTAGILTLKPYTPSTSIGINGGTGALGDVTAGFLGFLDTGTVSPARLVIGDAASGSGTVTIGDNWDVSAYGFPVSVYGGAITTGNITGGAHDLLLNGSSFTDASGNIIGGAGMSGNLTLAADAFFMASGTQLRTSGVMAFMPHTTSTGIGINGGAGALDASGSFLSLIAGSPGSVVIGNAASGTGTVTIGNNWDISSYSYPVSIYGGSVTTGSITAGNNPLLLNARAGDITLGSGAALTSTYTGTGLTLVASQDFINHSGASALNDANGRWLVYSTNPANDTLNGLTGFVRYSCAYGGSCPGFPASGNGLLYSYTPMLVATPHAISLTYGDAAPSLTGYAYNLSGYLGSDASGDNVSGTLNGTTSYAQYSDAGNYNIHHASGTLSSLLGYAISYADSAAITVNPKTLTATLTGLVSKLYDATLAAALVPANYSLSGIVNADNVTLNNPVSGTYGTKDAGTGKTVNVSGLSLSGPKAGNYTLASNFISGAVGEITPALLTVTADDKTRAAGQANPPLTGSIAGFAGSDTLSALSSLPVYSTAAALSSPAGFYSITASGAVAANYTFAYIDGTLTVTAATPSFQSIVSQVPPSVQSVSSGAALPPAHSASDQGTGISSDMAGVFGVYGNSSPMNVQEQAHANHAIPDFTQFDCAGKSASACRHE